MKRLVSCFLILCLMLSCTPGAVAAESASYAEYYTDSYESYLSSMNGWLWLDYLKNDNQFGFVQFSNKMEESTLLQKAISITIELMDGIHWNDIESPGNAEIAFYEDAILGLLVTMESELSSELDKQSEADATMTLMDYAVDGGQAAVDFAGAFVGGKAAADIFMPLLNGLTGSESLIQGAMKNLESDAQYKALARSAHLYCDFEKVLSAILIKSDNEALKTAAQNVLDGINQSFTYKLENISSYTGDTAIPQLGSFVFDDVLGKSIESGDITGESAAMVNLFRGVNAFNAGAGIGAFIGNSVVGGHDIFLRYFEMLAMAEIRDCLIEDISQRVSSVTGPEDYNEIREIQSYLYALLYTCQRGEYCMYSLLAKDYTGIARFIFGGKTKNVDEWYASTSNVLKTAYDRIGEFTPEIELNAVIESLPSIFTFSSGVGGWATEITLNADGTFSGQYHDSEMGDTGNQYPDGTVYISSFTGKFTAPKQVDEYTYSMKLDYLNSEGTIGDEYYENNQRYIISEPYGFDNADEFMIYLPGIAMSDLPEGFINWLYPFINGQTTEILPLYGIYNVGGKKGFVARNMSTSEKDTEINMEIKYEMRTETIEFRLSDGTLYYSNTIEYPYFSGNSAIESTLNQRYADMISNCKTNDTDFDASYQENLEWGLDASALPFYDDTLSEVIYNDRGAFSIKETYLMWSGGAHPYNYESALNYDLTTGAELTYFDILDGTDEEIDRILRYYFEKLLWTPTDYEISTLKEYTAYALCKDGLCFYYNVGDAVPRAEIIIPYTSDDTYVISANKLL